MSVVFLTSFLTLASSIFIATVSYLQTKRKEAEADLRKLRFEFYREFFLSLSQLEESHATDEDRIRFNNATNALYLVGPPGVLRALNIFRKVNSTALNSDNRQSVWEHAHADLVIEIRKDLRMPATKDLESADIRYWKAFFREEK